MFIQTEETPNPDSLKFLPGRIITQGEVVEYKDFYAAQKSSPLAAKLLEINGVQSVLFSTNSIIINKGDCEWKYIKPFIIDTIISFFLQHEDVFIDNEISANEPPEITYDEKDQKIVECIKELLETHIRSAVARDGGDIQFVKYKDGVVYLTMHGACSGCPSAANTLKQGVENLLRHFIPQIKEVKKVE